MTAAVTLSPALLLDRDGVLNVDKGYVGHWTDFEWIKGAKALIARYKRAGWLVIVVTNQSGVARGFYTEDDVVALHNAMNADLNPGERIDAFYSCPYHEDAVVDRYRVADHPDRKPNPGMILRVATDLLVDLASSLLIGDKQTDIIAAERAGVRGLLFTGADVDRFARISIGDIETPVA